MTDQMRDALEQALDRMETAWNHVNPRMTRDDKHAISQALWFGQEELRAVLDGEESTCRNCGRVRSLHFGAAEINCPGWGDRLEIV